MQMHVLAMCVSPVWSVDGCTCCWCRCAPATGSQDGGSVAWGCSGSLLYTRHTQTAGLPSDTNRSFLSGRRICTDGLCTRDRWWHKRGEREEKDRDEQTSVQMITELRMDVKLSQEWASKMMDKHTRLTTIWVVYSYRSVSVSPCLNMQTTNSKFWKRHLLISLSHYLSIYHHLCTHPLSLSLWGSHTAASCLCSPTTRLTYHLHGNEPTIFFLIVIGGMCDLSIKRWPGSCLLHRQTKVGGGQTRTLLKAPSSLSITFAASSSLHLCSRICLVQRIWLSRTTANTHKHCTNFALQHSVMLAHHPHFHNLLLLPDSTAFG